MSARCARLLVLTTLCLLALAPAAGAVKATPESYAAFQKQAAGGQVVKATVDPQKHLVKAKLKDGKTVEAPITAAQQAPLVASLKSKGAKVHVDKKKKKSSHIRYRYIVLIAIVVIAVLAAAWYLVRGRGRRGPGEPSVIEPGPSAARPEP
jgi:ATP-dependent Zn protease